MKSMKVDNVKNWGIKEELFLRLIFNRIFSRNSLREVRKTLSIEYLILDLLKSFEFLANQNLKRVQEVEVLQDESQPLRNRNSKNSSKRQRGFRRNTT